MLKKKISMLLAATLVTVTFVSSKPVSASPIVKNQNVNPKQQVQVVNNEKQAKDAINKSKGQKVTILYYCDADNNLEPYLLNDIEEMKRGYNNDPNLNLIALVDRAKGYSNDSKTLGENFTDTRLYKIEHNSTKRLDGGKEFPEITVDSNYEANMGNPETLKKFIDYGKANYKADKYVLIMSNHGGGAKNKPNMKKELNKAICWDDDAPNSAEGKDDCLYMAEISDNLTEKQSVDVLTFDACLMGTAEVAYQYRPGNGGFSADTMVAASPSVWGYGFKYDNIFSRIKAGGETSYESDKTLGGRERCFDPATITNEQIGAIFVEEQRDSTKYRNDQQLSFYDLSKVEEVKNSIDKLSVNLSKENEKEALEKLRGSKKNISLIHYFNEYERDNDGTSLEENLWIQYPYFDIYDLCEQITKSNDFSRHTKELASSVMKNVDDMVVYSFGQRAYDGKTGFKEGKNGLSIFLPDGSRRLRTRKGYIPHWAFQYGYNAIDTQALVQNGDYGKLSWCRDGIDPEINKVGNWFELLDSWFDINNDSRGGLNGYQW
ncbi:clostripain [Clostridiaceae bacterium 14S0207]|nr:clostripain [Clostridiaceae bacterium 14S0207]